MILCLFISNAEVINWKIAPSSSWLFSHQIHPYIKKWLIKNFIHPTKKISLMCLLWLLFFLSFEIFSSARRHTWRLWFVFCIWFNLNWLHKSGIILSLWLDSFGMFWWYLWTFIFVWLGCVIFYVFQYGEFLCNRLTIIWTMLHDRFVFVKLGMMLNDLWCETKRLICNWIIDWILNIIKFYDDYNIIDIWFILKNICFVTNWICDSPVHQKFTWIGFSHKTSPGNVFFTNIVLILYF